MGMGCKRGRRRREREFRKRHRIVRFVVQGGGGLEGVFPQPQVRRKVHAAPPSVQRVDVGCGKGRCQTQDVHDPYKRHGPVLQHKALLHPRSCSGVPGFPQGDTPSGRIHSKGVRPVNREIGHRLSGSPGTGTRPDRQGKGIRSQRREDSGFGLAGNVRKGHEAHNRRVERVPPLREVDRWEEAVPGLVPRARLRPRSEEGRVLQGRVRDGESRVRGKDRRPRPVFRRELAVSFRDGFGAWRSASVWGA